jgi:hypothetical protein
MRRIGRSLYLENLLRLMCPLPTPLIELTRRLSTIRQERSLQAAGLWTFEASPSAAGTAVASLTSAA